MNNTLKIITTLIFLSFAFNASAKCISGNCENGKGIWQSANGDKYTGDFMHGDRTGNGTITWASGAKYTGDFDYDERTGKGIYTWANGNKYIGDWVDGERAGKGTFTWASGNNYIGDFVKDKMHGKGTFTSASGTIKSGYWVDDKYWGTVAQWDAKVAKERAEIDRVYQINLAKEKKAEAERKEYRNRYYSCILEKGSKVDMTVDLMKKAIENVCREASK